MMNKPKNTSWEQSGKWYNKIVGTRGHYFHENLILPNVLRLLNLEKNSTLLDIGCGQGILAKKIPPTIEYTGIDLAKNLINFAKLSDKNRRHSYLIADATKPLPLNNRNYSHAAAILALQNIENAASAIQQVSYCLQNKGKFIIVLNHPCFRIPRQSGWGGGRLSDRARLRAQRDRGGGENQIQYRYINRYMSPLKIPINMHPGKNQSELTWSFHQPLSYYIQSLKANGFLVDSIEEWVSNKTSKGPAAGMENLARSEIPLFLAISSLHISL